MSGEETKKKWSDMPLRERVEIGDASGEETEYSLRACRVLMNAITAGRLYGWISSK